MNSVLLSTLLIVVVIHELDGGFGLWLSNHFSSSALFYGFLTFQKTV
jgi:hypothetical protein